MDYLRQEGVTFPNILDTSEAAQKICDKDYSGGGVPMNCLVGPDGSVLDAWIGHSEQRAKSALE